MVNPKKIPNIPCHLEFPFGAVSESILAFVDEIHYGNRIFQINAIAVDIDDKEEQDQED